MESLGPSNIFETQKQGVAAKDMECSLILKKLNGDAIL
jgi:hypothetical protein